MKFYRGSGHAARAYVEADHHRADDYYLAEGSGIAQMIEIRRAGGEVLPAVAMDSARYQQWVEGIDFATGLPKGRVRQDAHALRFAEVVVNGPKSWSLAAGLHPDVSVAYERAQGRAVEEIGRYVAANACTRLGSRGALVQVPVDGVEMAAVRHYTSRAGDPHRHIHLQFNARVPIGDKWRGIDSAAMLRMQRAINGIGHRAVVADPQFRQALAAHGYDLNSDGEINQLASVVPAMSKRTGQVAQNIERYEQQWRTENPGADPTAAQRRSWDLRAWGEARPDKVKAAVRGEVENEQWLAELRSLGVDPKAHRSAAAVAAGGITIGSVERAAAAERALAVLGSGVRGRSTWCVHDVRGAVEEVLSRVDVVGDRAAYREMAEDVAERAVAMCVSVVDRADMPEHVRHLTSDAVIELERDITGRLAVRGATDDQPATAKQVGQAEARLLLRGRRVRLDERQVAAVRAIAGTAALAFIEGAAGSGKTSMLAAAADVLAAQGRRMRVVAPTKRAAMVAAGEIGAESGTAAGLAYAYGFRWDRDGVWTRMAVGDTDSRGFVYEGPRAQDVLGRGDVLIVDEAGMLDQQTARALLHVADEAGAALVYIGDRRQLPAVGIGGVLDMVATWTSRQVELSNIHRFRRNIPDESGQLVNVADTGYAALSLQMRSGVDPGAVFDQLHADGHIRLWASESDALANVSMTIAARYLGGETQAISVATNDEASVLNAAVREQLVAAGAVSTRRTVNGADGLAIGVGDKVMTRSNNADYAVANRQTWTVTAVTKDGQLELAGAEQDAATVPADYIADFVHLAYATTGHGVQGETATWAELMVSSGTDAAALYVGMTRGRHGNTAHLVADTVDDAREQWVEAAGRDRADLGLDQARAAALAEAANYAGGPAQDLPGLPVTEQVGSPVLAETADRRGSGVGEGQRPVGSTGRARRSFAERMATIEERLATPALTTTAKDEYAGTSQSGMDDEGDREHSTRIEQPRPHL